MNHFSEFWQLFCAVWLLAMPVAFVIYRIAHPHGMTKRKAKR